eukprot:gnl/TRDRNA2_/TRDRNA2_32213_c0_seq2.p1 gnl/TRDRNA2_/TRDRNA2_32213_c0~~gnl/TRDRNA2_/TRDRNA2_32213_c0_seq2.p1  ORF type:complete len:313 (+),score=27.17 gnl/TRDRNA2_/TRDRNA2_32213_c0_seq2:43-981(+)
MGQQCCSQQGGDGSKRHHCALAKHCCSQQRFRAPSPGRQWRVLCIGDSLTAGGYPKILQSLLGSRGTVKDFGYFGVGVTSTALSRSYQCLPNFAVTIQPEAQHADVLIVMLGTNDAHCSAANDKSTQFEEDAFVSEYKSLLSELKDTEPGDKLVLLVVPPRMKEPNHQWDQQIIAECLPRATRQVAKDLSLPLVDPREALGGTEPSQAYYCPDGLHLSTQGSTVVAQVIHRALLDATLRWNSHPPKEDAEEENVDREEVRWDINPEERTPKTIDMRASRIPFAARGSSLDIGTTQTTSAWPYPQEWHEQIEK